MHLREGFVIMTRTRMYDRKQCLLGCMRLLRKEAVWQCTLAMILCTCARDSGP